MRNIVILISALLLAGCVDKNIQPSSEQAELIKNKTENSRAIQDLVNLPQNIESYTQNSNLSQSLQFDTNKYEKDYFSPWNTDKPVATRDDITWALKVYQFGKSYGENLQLIDEKFFDEMNYQFNLDEYQKINKRAIALKYVNIRALPTDKPLLLDPTSAGEGFPFDYLQNSSLQANKPIFVSHYSKDGEWAHIFSSFTYGWIKSDEMVFLKKEHTDKWQEAKQVFFTQENISINSTDGSFLFKSKIGTILPLISEDEKFYTVLVISSNTRKNPLFLQAKISKDIADKNYLAFNQSNLNNIINQVSQSNYGWGGMFGQRDCSSILRDLYSPFGLWLPRNSYQQSKVGEVISLKGLTDKEKEALIKEKAVPFKTLLYKKGHIMLYVGIYKDEIIVFHDTWGIKTVHNGEEGRIIIGKPVFSTLQLGSNQEYYKESSGLLRNLKSMNILSL